MAKKEPIVGEPYTWTNNKYGGEWIVIHINDFTSQVTLRSKRKNQTITLRKVKRGEETYLQPLTDSTEYPEGKKLPRKDPKDVTIRASNLLDRREASHPLQKVWDQDWG